MQTSCRVTRWLQVELEVARQMVSRLAKEAEQAAGGGDRARLPLACNLECSHAQQPPCVQRELNA